ncbi:MAG: alpha/beta fold hydrolase [Cyanobacteria bacterium J06614_10]
MISFMHRAEARAKRFHWRRALSYFGGICLGGGLPFLLSTPVAAAERVILTYGIVEISSSLDTLRTYAETGEVGDELAPYFRFLNEEQQTQFRQALQLRRDIDPVQMSQFLHSAIGTNILRSAGQVIQTQGRRRGGKALRSALVLAAAEPGGFTLLGALEKFPTGAVRIDSQRAFRLVNSVTGLIEDTDNAIAAIQAQSAPSNLLSAAVPPIDALAQPGPYAVTTQTLTVVDTERDREIPTDVYLPADAPAAAVVLISHGLAGDRKGFIPMSEHLASHGYAVVALDHPGSNRTQLNALLRGREREIAEPLEFSDRPRDISFLLDELTRLNEGNGPFAGRFDLSRVGIIGHSFGGYTALAVSGAQLNLETLQANCDSEDFIFNGANPSMLLQCTALLAPDQFSTNYRDERIDAVMALNPIGSSLFGEAGFSQLAIPSLLVSGGNDPIAPALLEQIQPFTWLNQPKVESGEGASGDAIDHYLALIEEGSHLYEEIAEPGLDTAPGSNGLVSADLPIVNDYLKSLSLGFVQAEVDQDPVYQDALIEASIVRAGQPSSPLYFVETLTAEMLVPPAVAPGETTGETPIEQTPVEDSQQ